MFVKTAPLIEPMILGGSAGFDGRWRTYVGIGRLIRKAFRNIINPAQHVSVDAGAPIVPNPRWAASAA